MQYVLSNEKRGQNRDQLPLENQFFDMTGKLSGYKSKDSHLSKDSYLYGYIELNPLTRVFNGDLYYCKSQVVPHKIKGHLIKSSNLVRLVFLRLTPNELENNPYNLFQLEKRETGSLAGNYHGTWHELSSNINCSNDLSSFIAQINPGILKNSGEISLSLGLVKDSQTNAPS
jgi:hypothetical protein